MASGRSGCSAASGCAGASCSSSGFATGRRTSRASTGRERDLIRAGVGHESRQRRRRLSPGADASQPDALGLCLMYFCMSYGWYFNLNYLPAYLKQQFGVTDGEWVGLALQGRPAHLRGGRLSARRLLDRPLHPPHRRPPLGAAPLRHVRPRHLRPLVSLLHDRPERLRVRAGHCLDRLLQRSGDGVGVGGLSGRGPKHAAIVAGCMNTIGNLGGLRGGRGSPGASWE